MILKGNWTEADVEDKGANAHRVNTLGHRHIEGKMLKPLHGSWNDYRWVFHKGTLYFSNLHICLALKKLKHRYFQIYVQICLHYKIYF